MKKQTKMKTKLWKDCSLKQKFSRIILAGICLNTIIVLLTWILGVSTAIYEIAYQVTINCFM